MSLLDDNLDINISDYYINLAVKYISKYGLYGTSSRTAGYKINHNCVRPAGYINEMGEFVDGNDFNFKHPEKLFIYVFYSVFERHANWLLCVGPDRIGPDRNTNIIYYKSRCYGTMTCLNKYQTILNLKDIIDEFVG